MKFKKVMSAALAGAMALSLSAPAFASGTEVTDVSEPTSVEVTGTARVPQIRISVPSTAAVTVNPYRLEVTVDDTPITDQVLSPTYYIVNNSDGRIQVSASVTGSVAGEAAFDTGTVSAGETDKKVYAYFEMAAVADGETAPDWSDAKEQLVLAATAKTTTANKEELMDAGTNEEATAKKAVAFHFAGDAASAPTDAWTAEDTIGASVGVNSLAAGVGGGDGSTPKNSGDHR